MSNKLVDYARSLLNQKVTVPSNPYGGQCVSYVDHLARHFTGKDLAYCNAIDLLGLAANRGFKVTYFNGGNRPPVGAIFVTKTYNHEFGHTGVIADIAWPYIETLEQNVDANWDALYNGGWVRSKQRMLYSDGSFTYLDGLGTQGLVGWFELPGVSSSTPQSTTSQSVNKKKGRNNMFGSFAFSVKEGDGEFIKGAVFFYNAATNEYKGISSQEDLKYLMKWYKDSTGESLPMETYTVKAPEYRRLFSALGASSKSIASRLDAIEHKISDTVVKETDAVEQQIKTLSNVLKGADIAAKQYFTAEFDINIRTKASITASKVGVLKKGTKVEIAGSASAGGYYWVSFIQNGQLVYVASKVEGGQTFGKVS